MGRVVPTAYLIDWNLQNGKLPPFYEQKMLEVSAVEKTNAKRAIRASVKVALGDGCGGRDEVDGLARRYGK